MGLLIVTCSPGNMGLCEQEIGNILYPYDPDIRIRWTRHKGVLIVDTRLDPMEAFRKLRSGEYGFVRRIVPLQKIVDPAVESIIRAVEEILEYGLDKVCLRIRIRGIRGLSSRVWNSVRELLTRRGIRVSRDAPKCIYIEGVDQIIGVSLLGNGEDRVV